jgi:hypothetical protein
MIGGVCAAIGLILVGGMWYLHVVRDRENNSKGNETAALNNPLTSLFNNIYTHLAVILAVLCGKVKTSMLLLLLLA